MLWVFFVRGVQIKYIIKSEFLKGSILFGTENHFVSDNNFTSSLIELCLLYFNIFCEYKHNYNLGNLSNVDNLDNLDNLYTFS